MTGQCPFDNKPVAKPGDTCNLACYAQAIARARWAGEFIDWMTDLYGQPWYHDEADKIERWVETHGRSTLHQE